jgi:DNA (cytosine-5)-methyltransferase 1
VFVVGNLRDWRRAAAVLFERESLSWNSAPRREAGEGTSADVAPSIVSSGRGVERTGDTRGQDPVIAVASTGNVAHCLNAGGMGRLDYETETMVAHALRGEGFDASEDGTGRGTPIIPIDMRQASRGETMTNNRAAGSSGGAPGTGIGEVGDPSPSLSTSHVPAIAFDCKASGRNGFAVGEISPTLRAMGHKNTHQNAGGQVAIAIQERAVCENPDAGPDGIGVRDDGSAYTLEARTVPQAVAFDMRGREGGSQFEGPHDTANIRAASGGSSRSYVAQTWAVRRLTPTECERLQGFPDGYTNVPWRGKNWAPDGPRYKVLGNSMAVNVMRWIGHRIQHVSTLAADEAIGGAEQ